MLKLRLSLIPENLQTNKFWKSINHRNIWLIKLRYGAVIMLTLLCLGLNYTPSLFGTINVALNYFWLITASILVYNLVFHFYKSKIEPIKGKENDKSKLTFSFIQIVFDLFSLLALVYFSGGVETPLFAFFIFHIIIGSLFLSRVVTNLLVSIILLISITGSYLEFSGALPHHSLIGLHNYSLYLNPEYLVIFFSFFGLVMYLSIYLASSIAKELYARESDLLNAYNLLEEAETSKMKYVISIVHDLKTPIAAAITYINMILDGTMGKITDVLEKPLNRSKIRLDNAISTINNILYISQLRLEPKIEDLEKIDFELMMNDIYNDFKDLIQNKKITYKFKSTINEENNFYAEPKLLKFAMANLISNAYKYTEENGKIVVSVYQKNNDIILSVADTGIGIPANEIDKIMNDFYRSSISKKKNIEGTGLGMSIVNQIIKRYGGWVKAKSPSYIMEKETSPGTEFIVYFPINKGIKAGK